MPQLDLNKVRELLKESNQRGNTRPDDPKRRVVVNRNGCMKIGDEADRLGPDEGSIVPQEVFAALWGPRGGSRSQGRGGRAAAPARCDRRLDEDRETVKHKLPPGTREITLEGTTAFVYDITDELGQPYTMAVYYDGCEYQVKVIHPQVEGKYSITTAHVFNDGRLCLRPPAGGLPRLDEAYAKSVLWATGFTVFLQTGQFPWPSHQ